MRVEPSPAQLLPLTTALSALAQRGAPPAHLSHELVRTLLSYLPALDGAAIYLRDGDRAVCAAQAGTLLVSEGQADLPPVLLDLTTPVGQAILTHEMVAEPAEPPAVGLSVIIPLGMPGSTRGALLVYVRDGQVLYGDVRGALQVAAQIMALALTPRVPQPAEMPAAAPVAVPPIAPPTPSEKPSTGHLLEQTQRSLGEVQALYDTSRRIALAEDVTEMLQALVDFVGPGCTACLDRYEEPRMEGVPPDHIRALVCVTVDGPQPVDLAASFAQHPLHVIYEEVVRGLPVIIPDIEAASAFDEATRSHFRARGVRSLAVLPLISGRLPVGQIVLSAATPEALRLERVRAYQSLADQIAIVLENHELLQQTASALAELRQVHKTAQAVLNASNEAAMLERLYERLYHRPDWLVLENLDYDNTGQVRQIAVAAVTGLEESATPVGTEYAPDTLGLAGVVARLAGGQNQIIEHVAETPDLDELARTALLNFDRAALAAIPLRDADGLVRYVVSAVYRQPHVFTYNELHALDALGEQAGVMLQNWQLVAATRRQTIRLQEQMRILRAMYGLANSLNDAPEPGALLSQAAESIYNALNVDHVGIVIFTPDHTVGHLMAEYPSRGDQTEVSFRLSDYAVYDALERTREPVVSVDVVSDERLDALRETLLGQGIRSLVIVPLIVGGSVIGSINLDLEQQQRPLTPDEIGVAQSFAAQLAIGIQNANLFSEVQHRVEQLQTTSDFGREVVATFEPARIYELIRVHLPELVPLDHLTLCLYDETDDAVHVAMAEGIQPPDVRPGAQVSLERTAIGLVIESGGAMLLSDVTSVEYADMQQLAEAGIRSVLIIPLRIGGTVLGTLTVGYTHPNAYTTAEVALAQQATNMVAVALENARLYQHAQQELQERRRAEEHLEQVLTGARCLFWHAVVEERDEQMVWNIQMSNPEAAQSFLPLDLAPGQSYTDAWFQSKLPEDRERMDALAHTALRSGLPSYSQEFRCRGADGLLQWLYEDVQIKPLGPHRWQLVGVCTDITERKLAEESRQQQLAFLQTLIDVIPTPIFYKDSQGIYVGCNKAFEAYLGRSRDQIIGKTVYEISPSDLAEQYHQADLDLIAQGGTQTYESAVVYADGTYHNVIFNKAVFTNPDGSPGGLVGTILDITERKQAEETLRKTHDELEKRVAERTAELGQVNAALQAQIAEREAMYERRTRQVEISTAVTQEIAAAPGLDELFRRVVTLIKERFGYYHAQVFRTDPASGDQIMMEGYGEAGRAMKAAGHRIAYGKGVVGTAAKTRQPVLAADVSRNRHWVPNPHLPDTKGELAVPILLRGSVLGVIDVQSDQPGHLGEEDQLLLMGMAGQIGIAIESTRLLEERLQVEEALKQERALLRALIDAVPDYIYAKDADSRFLVANTFLASRVGVADPEDLLGKTDFDFFPEEIARKYYNDEQTLVQTDQALLNEEELTLDAEGNRRWLLTSKVPLHDAQGRVIGLVGVGHDITHRKQAEARLAEERTLLRTLIDTIPDHIYVKDRQSRIIVNNTAHACRLFGLESPQQAVGKSDFDFFPPELAERYFADEQNLMSTDRAIIDLEEPSVDSAGVTKWHLTTKVPLHNSAGEVIGLVGITRDITERKQAENLLAQERNLLRTLIDAIPDYIYVKDRQSRFIVSNKALACGLFGLASPEDVAGKSDADFFPESLAVRYRAEEQELMLYGEGVIDMEHASVDMQGNPRWHLTTKVPLRDSSGEIVGLVGITRDITERKQIEENLRLAMERTERSQRLLRTVIDATPDWIFAKDQEFRYVLVNAGYARALGMTPEEMLGKDDLELGFPPEQVLGDPAKGIRGFRTDDQAALLGQVVHNPHDPATFADGSVHIFDTQKYPLLDTEGRVFAVLGLARDITDREQAQMQLQELYRRTQTHAAFEERLNYVTGRLQQRSDITGLLSIAMQELGMALGARTGRVRLSLPGQAGNVERGNGNKHTPDKEDDHG